MAAIRRLGGRWSLACAGEGVFLAGLTSRRMEGKRLVERRGLQSLFGGVPGGGGETRCCLAGWARAKIKVKMQLSAELGKSYILVVILIFDVGREPIPPPSLPFFFFSCVFYSLIAMNAIILDLPD